MNGMEHTPVRDLLGAAVESVEPGTGGGTAELFARAARVRRRRRAGVISGVAALAAGATVLAPQLGGPAPQAMSPASQSTSGTGDPGVAYLQKLLPGIGTIQRGALTFSPGKVLNIKPKEGALEGTYTVRKDGRVGYFYIGVVPAKQLVAKMGKDYKAFRSLKYNPCEPHDTSGMVCTTTRVPQGRLTIEDWPSLGNGRGREYSADLLLADGRVIHVQDGSGLDSMGPRMANPPLTKAQLRTLVLDPRELRKP